MMILKQIPQTMKRNFAAFIITHDRVDSIHTDSALDACGYTGPVYYVVDDKDPALDAYRRAMPADRLLVFSKDAMEPRIHMADNFPGQKTTLYAREKVFDFAEDLGYTHFILLDDDYSTFSYRLDARGDFCSDIPVKQLDTIFARLCDFLDATPTHCIALAQNGDFIGGAQNPAAVPMLKRKAMNTFVCRTDRYFPFHGRFNEDVNMYLKNGRLGRLYFTFMPITVIQSPTQSLAGGLTETYLEYGTYVKSFYSVMHAPSCVKVSVIGQKHQRLHHRIQWRYAVPHIVPPTAKK